MSDVKFVLQEDFRWAWGGGGRCVSLISPPRLPPPPPHHHKATMFRNQGVAILVKAA